MLRLLRTLLYKVLPRKFKTVVPILSIIALSAISCGLHNKTFSNNKFVVPVEHNISNNNNDNETTNIGDNTDKSTDKYNITARKLRHEKYDLVNAKVIKVYDADTITIIRNKEKIRLRFYGIDAPEKKQNYGIQARNALDNMIAKGNYFVNVKFYDKDRYGRIVSEVFVGDLNLNKWLVQNGYVFIYDKYNKKLDEYKPLENIAKSKGIGVWNPNNKVISPEQWRREHK